MAQTISPMQMMVSIVERGKGAKLIEHYKKFNVAYHIQAAGRGTAASHLMDTFGFGSSERDLLLSIAPRDTLRQLMWQLKDEDRSKLGARGLAFTLNLSGMTAFLAVALNRVEKMDPEKGDVIMDNDKHSLILVTANHGFTDEIMNTARSLGARGGTVVRARWVEGGGSQETDEASILQEEKEVLALVVENRVRNVMMTEINRLHGSGSPAQATVISVPVNQTARLD